MATDPSAVGWRRTLMYFPKLQLMRSGVPKDAAFCLTALSAAAARRRWRNALALLLGPLEAITGLLYRSDRGKVLMANQPLKQDMRLPGARLSCLTFLWSGLKSSCSMSKSGLSLLRIRAAPAMALPSVSKELSGFY
jgi:hypothetical protein